MLKEIHNAFRFTAFLLVLIILCIISVIPVALRNFDTWATALPFVGIGISLLIIAYLRPAYFYISLHPDRLRIKTNALQDDFLQIMKYDYAGYNLHPTLKGINQELILFRKTPQGLMKSRPIKISFFSPEKTRQLTDLLETFKS